jgi:glycosyltransferase involved in cell wall biosynthesis
VLIRDAKSGFLVPPRAAEAFAARVIELLRDPQAARRMGEAGQRCVQTFTVARMVGEYEALYDRLLAGSPAPRTDVSPGQAG